MCKWKSTRVIRYTKLVLRTLKSAPKVLITCYEPAQCNQWKIKLNPQLMLLLSLKIYSIHWNLIFFFKKKERKRNNNKNATYIESRKQGNNHTCKIYSCCVNSSRIKHHCHLSFWAYEECCAAIKKNGEKTSLTSERKAG